VRWQVAKTIDNGASVERYPNLTCTFANVAFHARITVNAGIKMMRHMFRKTLSTSVKVPEPITHFMKIGTAIRT
jgi:hypothetical protein